MNLCTGQEQKHRRRKDLWTWWGSDEGKEWGDELRAALACVFYHV